VCALWTLESADPRCTHGLACRNVAYMSTAFPHVPCRICIPRAGHPRAVGPFTEAFSHSRRASVAFSGTTLWLSVIMTAGLSLNLDDLQVIDRDRALDEDMRHAIVCEDLWGAAGAQLVGPLVVSAHRLSWYRVQGAPPVKVHP